MSLIDKQNPIVTFIYFLLTIIITMFTMNPIILVASFVSSLLLFCLLVGIKRALIRICYSLLFILLITIINPLFSRQGMTELFAISSLVVTLESVLNGVAIGIMLSSVINWISVLNILLDTDKISYIFSKYTPKIGTILSVSLGLFPKYIVQYKVIDNNLKGLGLYNKVNAFYKIKLKLHTLSTLISWSIEGALTLSDSMSARGYDLKGKRVYNKYKFTPYDILFLLIILSVGILVLVFLGLGIGSYYYYPTFKQIAFDSSIWIYFVIFAFMNFMSCQIVGESVKWQYLKSKI